MLIISVVSRCRLILAPKVCNVRYSQIMKCCEKINDVGLQNHAKVLEHLLGWSPEESQAILEKNPNVWRYNHTVLERTIRALQRYGVLNEEIRNLPEVLSMHPFTLFNYASIFQEAGAEKLTVRCVVDFLFMVKKRISLVKAHGVIPQDLNVAEHLMSQLVAIPPDFHPLPYRDMGQVDETILKELHLAAIKRYLMWELDLTPDKMDAMVKKCPRLKYKSLRTLRRNLEIARSVLGITLDKICRNVFVLYADPDNTLAMIENIPQLGGMDIREVLNKHPKILMGTVDNILKTQQYIKDFGISDDAIQRCLLVFTLNCETVLQRLVNLEKVPELRVLIPHPNIFKLVFYQRRALERLKYLHEHRCRCSTVHLLSVRPKAFQRYLDMGEDRTRGWDMVRAITWRLGLTSAVVRRELKRHKQWLHIPVLTVSETLDFLLDRGFSKEDITANLYIVLYCRETVEEELNKLDSRMETRTAQELCNVPVISPERRLALCLYYIERVHHFTGDGVWITKDKDSSIDMPL